MPVVAVKALGLSPPAKPLGYEGVVFYLPTAQRDDIEMIVSEVGEQANWKICANANIDKSHSSAKVKYFFLVQLILIGFHIASLIFVLCF